MEIWDIYDRNCNLTGRTIRRSSILQKDEYHLVVHVWIVDSSGYVLIQKRPEHLEWMPGIWATTGGSAIHGEESLPAAVRETQEELGLTIEPNRFKHYKRQLRENDFTDIYVVEGCKSEFVPNISSDEVADAKWVSLEEIRSMVQKGEFINYDYMGSFLDYINAISPGKSS